MPERSANHPTIVISGGGVAAVEAVLALRATATAPVNLVLISAAPAFRMPAMATLKPFARGHSDELPLSRFMEQQGGRFVQGRVAAVDAGRQVVVLGDATEVPYDELLVAVGGQPVKGTDQGTGFDPATPDVVAGVASDLELGWAESVAVIVPDGPTWPMPGYELALQLAHTMGGASMGRGHVHLFIPTDDPVPFFGARGIDAVRAVLVEAGVELHTGIAAQVVRTGLVELGAGREPLKVDRVLAIPRIVGPAIAGLPVDEDGFICVDARGRVDGLPHVHAAGDGTTIELKFGAVSCQQADAAVADLLAGLGHEVSAKPLDPVYDARLVAGDREVILHHDPSGAGRPGADWSGGAKIAGRYLTPFLNEQGIGHVAHREAHREAPSLTPSGR